MTGLEQVVNLHVTEACNYRCLYCFGHWKSRPTSVLHELEGSKRVIEDIARYLRGADPRQSVRMNFVGGEPGLLNHIGELISWTRTLDLRVSYVTNGLMLNKFNPRWTADHIDIVGLSIDSIDRETNLKLGRRNARGEVLDHRTVALVINQVRKFADPTIKINTVVNALNHTQDMGSILDDIRPRRWKVLRALPVYAGTPTVTGEQFRAFVERHQRFADIMVTEDNDQMTGSYYMVDPASRLFWHRTGEDGYRYSEPIATVGAVRAFASIEVDEEKYARRYADRRHAPLSD